MFCHYNLLCLGNVLKVWPCWYKQSFSEGVRKREYIIDLQPVYKLDLCTNRKRHKKKTRQLLVASQEDRRTQSTWTVDELKHWWTRQCASEATRTCLTHYWYLHWLQPTNQETLASAWWKLPAYKIRLKDKTQSITECKELRENNKEGI